MRELTFHLQLQDLWGIIFVGCAFLNSESVHFSDIQAFHLLTLCILYVSVRILSELSQYLQLMVITGLVVFLLGEALAGFGQMYGYYYPPHFTLRMSGTFGNPESYCGFLACMLPLPLSLALRANDAPGKRYLILPVVSGICTFLVVSLLPAGMNPSCWLAAGVGGYVVVIHHFRTLRNYKILLRRYPKRVVFFTLVLVILLVKSSFLMYDLLKNPEENRDCLWEESLRLIGDSPREGYGLGSFHTLIDPQRLYTVATETADSPAPEPAVSETSYCFNEYLRITVENGIPGLVFFLLFLSTGIYNACRNQQAGLLGCILAFMVFAYFSNIYDIFPLSATLTVVLALCGRKSALLQPRPNKRHAYCSILSQ